MSESMRDFCLVFTSSVLLALAGCAAALPRPGPADVAWATQRWRGINGEQLGLDRRTVKAKVDPLLLERLRG